MLQRILIVGLLGFLLVQPLAALNFTGRVSASRDFVIDLTLFGSLELLLDANWTKRSADLDWLVECDFGGDTFTQAVSQTTETRFEDLQVGLFGGGDGLECRAILFSFSGSSKVSVNVRTTGSESATSTLEARALSSVEVPGLHERIQAIKVMKRGLIFGD